MTHLFFWNLFCIINVGKDAHLPYLQPIYWEVFLKYIFHHCKAFPWYLKRSTVLQIMCTGEVADYKYVNFAS